MKLGVVDVGGGLRGIYAAGVFDWCMDNGIQFDLCVGVSAGSANVASYLAGQRGRNYSFYIRYPFRKEYMSARNLLTKHSYLDLNYVYGTLSCADGENPLDFPALCRNSGELAVVASNAQTGEARYFGKGDLSQDHYEIFSASSAIPFVCRPCVIDGAPYYDGALSDPVPVETAFRMGCDKVVLLLTRPKDQPRQPGKDPFFARRIQRSYPVAAENLCRRAERYNAGVAAAERYAAEGKALIVAPDTTYGLDTLSRDRSALRRFYAKGYQDGAAIGAFVQTAEKV